MMLNCDVLIYTVVIFALLFVFSLHGCFDDEVKLVVNHYTQLYKSHVCVLQSCAELERERQQLNSLHRELAESRDRCDVTTADSQQLTDHLAAAERTSAQYRDALRAKVVKH